ncbi:MAG: hypothetical protein AAFZ52_11440, partial [Bacteroidota bacterium]
LSAHYQKLSRRLAVKVLPPEGLVRNLGWGAQYGEKNMQKAQSFFALNVKNYPASANAFKVMGEVHEAQNKIKEALKYYRRSFAMNATDKLLEEKIIKLTNK